MMSDKQIDNAEELKDYIEDRIRKYTFHAKNFSKEDMDFVDTFCKDCYDNNRKLMVLDLIKNKISKSEITILDDKLDYFAKFMSINLETIFKALDELKEKEPEKKKKVPWKGFG